MNLKIAGKWYLEQKLLDPVIFKVFQTGMCILILSSKRSKKIR